MRQAIKSERNSGVRLRAVMDALVDEMMVIDRDYRIVEVNGATLRRYGKTRDEVIGRLCYEVSHGLNAVCRSPDCECPVARVWETGEAARVTHLHLCGDGAGALCYVDIIASPLRDEAGNVTRVVELMRDVTQARETETAVARAHEDLLALNAITAVVSQSLDVDTVLGAALDKTLELLKADIGGILLWDDSGSLRYRAHRGLSADYVRDVACRPGQGIAGLAAKTGKAILVEDMSRDPRAAHTDLIAAEGLRGFAAVPLPAKAGVLGVLTIASRDARRFTPQDAQLLKNIAALVGTAIEKARLHQEVQHQDQLRGELLNKVFAIQEEERKRIARELHDETGQALVALAAKLEAIIARLPEQDTQLKAQLRSLQGLAVDTVDGMNKLIYELRPSMLDDLGLVPAVRALANRELESNGVTVELKVVGRQKRLKPKLESTLFRVIQEAINNIARHAHAGSVGIILEFRKSAVRVRVTDDGRGFDVRHALRTGSRLKSLGLLGMRERVLLVDGALEIHSEPGSSTEITIDIPLVEGKTK